MNYFSLNDGTVINLDAIAYFHPHPTPRPKAQIEIVFASACRNEAGGIQSLTLVLGDKDTATFLNEMENQGVNVQGIRKGFDLLDAMKRLAEEGSK
jgi:hypothetical protein